MKRKEGGDKVLPVPGPRATWSAISPYAIEVNGYDLMGSQAACAKFANATRERFERKGDLPKSVKRLRACLFYERRRFHFTDDIAEVKEGRNGVIHVVTSSRPTADDMRYVRALLARIRSLSSDKNVRRYTVAKKIGRK